MKATFKVMTAVLEIGAGLFFAYALYNVYLMVF